MAAGGPSDIFYDKFDLMSDLIYRPQIEVLSTADRVLRRQWSDENKLQIVEDKFCRPPASDSHGPAVWHLPVGVDYLASAVSER